MWYIDIIRMCRWFWVKWPPVDTGNPFWVKKDGLPAHAVTSNTTEATGITKTCALAMYGGSKKWAEDEQTFLSLCQFKETTTITTIHTVYMYNTLHVLAHNHTTALVDYSALGLFLHLHAYKQLQFLQYTQCIIIDYTDRTDYSRVVLASPTRQGNDRY